MAQVRDAEGTEGHVTCGSEVLLTLQLLSEHGKEDGEVDGAAGLLDHSLQFLILHVQLAWWAETRQG